MENELCKKRLKGVVGIGAMSDTYNPMEIKYKQTRGALQLISKYDFGVSIDTKSNLILRDIDLLKEINSKNSVIIKFTITTPDDKLSKIIDTIFSILLNLDVISSLFKKDNIFKSRLIKLLEAKNNWFTFKKWLQKKIIPQ